MFLPPQKYFEVEKKEEIHVCRNVSSTVNRTIDIHENTSAEF